MKKMKRTILVACLSLSWLLMATVLMCNAVYASGDAHSEGGVTFYDSSYPPQVIDPEPEPEPEPEPDPDPQPGPSPNPPPGEQPVRKPNLPQTGQQSSNRMLLIGSILLGGTFVSFGYLIVSKRVVILQDEA